MKRLVFSSSSTVYGPAKYFPTDEEHPTGQGVTNPYGRSKFVCEEMMKDLAKAEEVRDEGGGLRGGRERMGEGKGEDGER